MIVTSLILAALSACTAIAAGLLTHKGRMREDPENPGYFMPPSEGNAPLLLVIGSALLATLSAGAAVLTSMNG